MTVEDLLSAARSGLMRGAADDCADAACLAFASAEDAATRARAAVLAGGAMLHKGLPADAIVWADLALALAPGDAEALAQRGWAQELLGRHADALADLDAAVVARPDLADARLSHAIVAHELGRQADADADLAAIIDDPRQGPVAHRIRGDWERDAGDLLGARRDFTAAARGGDTRALTRLIELGVPLDEPGLLLTWARLRDRHGEPAAALSLVERALRHDGLSATQRADAEAERAMLLLHVGDHAGALAAFTAAVAASPGDPTTLAELGGALGRAGRLDEALEALDRALAIDPDAYLALLYRAEALMDAGDHARAEPAWREVLRVAPGNVPALLGRGRALLECERYDHAAASLCAAAVAGSVVAADWCHEHAMVLPDDHVAQARLALERHDFGAAADHFAAASTAYLEYSRADGDHAHREAASALAQSAFARHRQHDEVEAIAQLERAVRMRPALHDAWLRLGDARRALGRYADALVAYDRCVWIDPTLAEVELRRADMLRVLGRGGEQLAALTRAMEARGEGRLELRASWRRARAHQAMGRWDAAEADYRRCATIGAGRVAAAVSGIAVIRALAGAGAGAGPAMPYRQYGLRPTAWTTSPELAARLQFATLPDAATRAAIAGAAYQAARLWFECDRSSCRWADRFAVIRLRSIDDEPAFEGLAAVIAAIHEVAPLREAVGWNAIGVNARDPAEIWSIATCPVPDAGPEFAAKIGFWVPAIADVSRRPRPHDDEDFDEAWQAAAAAVERAVADARPAASTDERARGEILLIPVDEIPAEPELADTLARHLRDEYDRVHVGPGGAGLILRHRAAVATSGSIT